MNIFNLLILIVFLNITSYATDEFEEEVTSFKSYLKSGQEDDFKETPKDFIARFQSFAQVCKKYFLSIPNASTVHHAGWLSLAHGYYELAKNNIELADYRSIPFFINELERAEKEQCATIQWFEEFALSLSIAMSKPTDRLYWRSNRVLLYLTELCYKAGADVGPIEPAKISEVLSWLGNPVTRCFGTPKGVSKFFPHVIPLPTPWYNLSVDDILLTLPTPNQPLWLIGWNCSEQPFVMADDIKMNRGLFAFHDWFHLYLYLSSICSVTIKSQSFKPQNEIVNSALKHAEKKIHYFFEQITSMQQRILQKNISEIEKFNLFYAFHEQGLVDNVFLSRLKHNNLWPKDNYDQLKNPNFYKPILPTILKNNISEKIINVLNEDKETKKNWFNQETEAILQESLALCDNDNSLYNLYFNLQPFDLFGEIFIKPTNRFSVFLINNKKKIISIYTTAENIPKTKIFFNPFLVNFSILLMVGQQAAELDIHDEGYNSMGTTTGFLLIVSNRALDSNIIHKYDFTALDKLGNTILMQAVYRNKLESVKWLLNKGVDWKAQNDQGFTALHIALNKKYLNIAYVLLDVIPDYQNNHYDSIWDVSPKGANDGLFTFFATKLNKYLNKQDKKLAAKEAVKTILQKINLNDFLVTSARYELNNLLDYIKENKYNFFSYDNWAALFIGVCAANNLNKLKDIWLTIEKIPHKNKIKDICFITTSYANDTGSMSAIEWAKKHNNNEMLEWLSEQGFKNR